MLSFLSFALPSPSLVLLMKYIWKLGERMTLGERQGQCVTYITQEEQTDTRSIPLLCFLLPTTSKIGNLLLLTLHSPPQEMRAGGRFVLALSKKNLNI